jgi:hypothetical protein
MMMDGSEAALEVGPFRIKVDEEAEEDRFYRELVPFGRQPFDRSY